MSLTSSPALRFSNHVTKRNGGPGDENDANITNDSCSLYACSETIMEREYLRTIKPEAGFSGLSRASGGLTSLLGSLILPPPGSTPWGGKMRDPGKEVAVGQTPLIERGTRFASIVNALNTERSYKRQGHAPLKHFVGFHFLCNGGKQE